MSDNPTIERQFYSNSWDQLKRSRDSKHLWQMLESGINSYDDLVNEYSTSRYPILGALFRQTSLARDEFLLTAAADSSYAFTSRRIIYLDGPSGKYRTVDLVNVRKCKVSCSFMTGMFESIFKDYYLRLEMLDYSRIQIHTRYPIPFGNIFTNKWISDCKESAQLEQQRIADTATRKKAERDRQEQELKMKEAQARRATEEARQRSEDEQRRRAEETRRHQDAQRVQIKDEAYYGAVLGLKGEVTPSKIRRIYRDLVAQYHPDKVHHLGPKLRTVAEQEMKAINEAYDFFRKTYDL